jgi:hypothetical protein
MQDVSNFAQSLPSWLREFAPVRSQWHFSNVDPPSFTMLGGRDEIRFDSCCRCGHLCCRVPASAEEVGVGVGPVGVTVGAGHDRDRDRDHDRTVIRDRDEHRDRDTVIIKKDHDRDGDRDHDKTIIDRR